MMTLRTVSAAFGVMAILGINLAAGDDKATKAQNPPAAPIPTPLPSPEADLPLPAVEPIAARLAAERADDAQREHLLAHATRLNELGAQGLGDTEEYLEADIAYHSLLLRAGGNPLFGKLSEPIAEILRGRAVRGLTPSLPRVGTLEAHVATAQAIVRRDGASAEASAREHLRLVSGEVAHA